MRKVSIVCLVLAVLILSPNQKALGVTPDEAAKFRIAMVQMDSSPGKRKNLEKIGAFSERAAGNNAEIICFPELSITGYERNRPAPLAETIDGESARTVSGFARKHRIVILAGLIEKKADHLYITQIVAFPDGRVEVYRKTHLGRHERNVFTAGTRLPVFHAKAASGETVCFAVGICYDMHFPDIAAVYSLKGAQILFSPHASPLGGDRRLEVWNRYLGARAYDNTLYVAACNHMLGKGTKMIGSGIGIWDYTSARLMKKCVAGDETILYCDLNLDALRKKRHLEAKTFFLKDRREDLYFRSMDR